MPEAAPAIAPEGLPELDFDALDRAAEAHIAQSVAAKSKKKSRGGRPSTGRYSQTVAAKKRGRSTIPPPERASIFDEQVVRSKSLDEVILSYLADDPIDDKQRS